MAQSLFIRLPGFFPSPPSRGRTSPGSLCTRRCEEGWPRGACASIGGGEGDAGAHTSSHRTAPAEGVRGGAGLWRARLGRPCSGPAAREREPRPSPGPGRARFPSAAPPPQTAALQGPATPTPTRPATQGSRSSSANPMSLFPKPLLSCLQARAVTRGFGELEIHPRQRLHCQTLRRDRKRARTSV